jgi:hypothetical protein
MLEHKSTHHIKTNVVAGVRVFGTNVSKTYD